MLHLLQKSEKVKCGHEYYKQADKQSGSHKQYDLPLAQEIRSASDTPTPHGVGFSGSTAFQKVEPIRTSFLR